MLKCFYCNQTISKKQELRKHLESLHKKEIINDYIVKNIPRESMARKLSLADATFKKLLNTLEIRKSKSLSSKNAWATLSKENRSTRLSELRIGRLKNSSWASLEKNDLSRLEKKLNTELLKEKRTLLTEEYIFDKLDQGFTFDLRIPFKNKPSKTWYRKWRKARDKDQCDVCFRCDSGQSREFAIDHDHKTGKIRGLLCIQCNVQLGWLEKNSENIDKYLITKFETSINYHSNLLSDKTFPYERGQEVNCGICVKRQPLGLYLNVIDHDANTGLVRGFLCNSCNVKLSYLESEKFISYINNAPKLGIIYL